MSLAAELTKLQERKEAILQEAALIDKELESVALALGVRHKPGTYQPVRMGARQRRQRTEYGTVWTRVEFWLRAQATAKTNREICEGTMFGTSSVSSQLSQHRAELIHRGNRWGVSESQFADHSADLEEQRSGITTPKDSTSPTAPSLTGATATSNVLTTTESTAPGVTDPAPTNGNG